MKRSDWRNLLIAVMAMSSPCALAADPPSTIAVTAGSKSDQPVDWAGLPIDELRSRANANELAAMEEIGRRLIQGVNAPKDPQAGAGWLLRAAELGSAQAAFSIGVMYERGFVVQRDSTRAAEWYRKAADGDVPMAKHNLALMIREGRGTPRDGKAAVELLRAAAQQGMTASMFVLGDMYERGDAGTKDEIMALAWFAIAAEFDRQANQGNETPLAKTASQRSRVLQRTLMPAELIEAQDIAQREFRQIVEAMTPDPAKPFQPDAAPATQDPATAADDEAVGWPKTYVDQVRVTQQALVDLKLLRDKPDGIVGPLTRTAIRDFQRGAGLRVTGEPSKQLYLALKLAQRDVVGHSPLPAPPKAQAKAEPPPESPWPADQNDQVRAIQELLAELKFYAAEPDGQLGRQTRAAIRAYERSAGLKETGEPTKALFESLKESRGLMVPKAN